MSLPQAQAPLTRRGIPLERDLRVLALGSFANRFGAGAVMTTSALYFTRQVGFSAAEVALALAVAAVVGILVQVPAGQLGDSHGPRRVLTVCMVGAALTSALPVLARTPWQLALLLALLTLFERSAGSVQQGVIAQLATGGRGVQFKAYLRAVTNTAIGLGSVFGGAALVVDESWAYVSVFVLNAVFTGFAAWNTTRLPDLPAYVRLEGEPRLAVLRDWPVRGRGRADGTVLAPLLRDGARPGALHLRAHGGTAGDGGCPARPQHRLRRALPGAALAPCRLRRGRRPGAGPRRRVDRGRLRHRRPRRPRRRHVRRRGARRRVAGARRGRDDRLGRPVGPPDGPRTPRAAGPVPGLRRARLQRDRRRRPPGGDAAVRRDGRDRLAGAGRADAGRRAGRRCPPRAGRSPRASATACSRTPADRVRRAQTQIAAGIPSEKTSGTSGYDSETPERVAHGRPRDGARVEQVVLAEAGAAEPRGRHDAVRGERLAAGADPVGVLLARQQRRSGHPGEAHLGVDLDRRGRRAVPAPTRRPAAPSRAGRTPGR